ncbi:MAG: hypothetical protein ACM3Q2_00900 [Syntrophothermus sp.]
MNYISDLVSDAVYEKLAGTGMLSTAKLRNYYIRRRFKELRNSNIRPTEAIRIISEELPLCSPELIRQKVYSKKN